jgi:tripartite-type tricarboxylate transporter receptor subunit TctC
MRSQLKKWVSAIAVAVPFLVATSTSVNAADWKPPGPVKLMIAFAAGGGADTQARLIAEEIEASTGWKFIPENVTGKGGVNLLNAMKGMPNDGTVIGMVVTETLGYNRVAAKGSGLELSDFTALTTTAGSQMGIVAKTDSGMASFDDVIAAAKGGKEIRFGVMSPRLGDIAYLLGQAHDIEFNLVSLKGGKAVMNALNAGDIDIGWGAGIQTKAVVAGDMVNLVSGIPKPLDASPDAPLIKDLGVDYDAGAYFMLIAPGGMEEDVRNALAKELAAVAENPDSKAGGLIKKAFGGAMIIQGAELDARLAAESEGAAALMKASE